MTGPVLPAAAFRLDAREWAGATAFASSVIVVEELRKCIAALLRRRA